MGAGSRASREDLPMRCPCDANELPDDARFCAYCGRPVAVGATQRSGSVGADAETIVVRAPAADATPPVVGVPVDLTPPLPVPGPPPATPAPTAADVTAQPPAGVAAPSDAAGTPAPTPPDAPAMSEETPAPTDASPAPVQLHVAAARVYDVPTPPPGPDESVAAHLRPALRRLARGPLLLATTAGAAATALLLLLVAALLWRALPETNRSLLGIPSNLSDLRGSLAVWTTLHGIGGAAEGAGDTPLLGPLLALAAAAAGGVAALEVVGRDRPARARRAVGLLVGVPYAVIGLVVVAASRDESWAPNAFAAVPACGVIGALGGLLGVEAWHRRGRSPGGAAPARSGLGSVVAGTLRLLALASVVTLLIGLVGNAVAIGTGEETDTAVGAWYAGLYAVEHAVSLLVLGLGAVAERAGVLGVPLLLDGVEALPRRFRVTGLDAVLPGLVHAGLVILLALVAYGLFARAGYRAARSAGPAVAVGPLLLRWAVVTGVLAVALVVLVALAYPVSDDGVAFGPRPASVLAWTLVGGGAAAFVGLVLGAPQRVVRQAAGAVTAGLARLRGARRAADPG